MKARRMKRVSHRRPASAAAIIAAMAAVCGLGISGCSTVSAARSYASQAVPGSASADNVYASQVQPILKSNCYRCHAGMFHKGGLQLNTPEAIMKGGHNGAVVVPGHPEQSLLVKLIRHEGPANDPRPMPPKKKISDADIATIEKWISDGAVFTAPAAPAVAK